MINLIIKNIMAIGGIIIGYEVGRLMNLETIFCERVNGKFTLRRGFDIKKNQKILIVEDVITTGKSRYKRDIESIGERGGLVVNPTYGVEFLTLAINGFTFGPGS